MSSNQNSRIREIISILDHDKELPTLSPVVDKILKLVSDEKISIQQIAGVIQNDVSLSFKILKVVNSAFYGYPRKVGTLSQAMVILGLAAVKNLALSMSILEVFMQTSKSGPGNFNFKVIWERSLLSAVAARRLAILAKDPREEEIFMASLLQDVGILVFIKYFPDEYSKLMETSARSATELINLEDQHFGINHTLLGEFLTNKWQLPRSLSVPILRHHEPENTLRGGIAEEDPKIISLTQFVHLSHLASAIFYDEYRPDFVTKLVDRADKYFKIKANAITELLDNLSAEAKEVAEFFGLPPLDTRSYSELIMAANIELGRINLSYDQMNRELIASKRRAEELAEQLAAANTKLQDMANIDGLTQINNRRVFQNLIAREFYRSNRYGHPLSCIMIDLDNFKLINDREGHLVGDQVLRGVANALQNSLRKSDFLARYGGEEFVAILPEADQKAATIIAEKLRKAVENHFFDIETRQIKVTISLGVSTFCRETHFAEDEALIERADVNLYHAKRHGRNRYWTDQDTLRMENPVEEKDLELENAALTS
ncbi:MAG: GGDEF domain-containing protein [bacterium]|nr:GGDEF domain-containing protein [bacterium]